MQQSYGGNFFSSVVDWNLFLSSFTVATPPQKSTYMQHVIASVLFSLQHITFQQRRAAGELKTYLQKSFLPNNVTTHISFSLNIMYCSKLLTLDWLMLRSIGCFGLIWTSFKISYLTYMKNNRVCWSSFQTLMKTQIYFNFVILVVYNLYLYIWYGNYSSSLVH